MKFFLLEKLFVLCLICLTVSCSNESINEDSVANEKSEFKINKVLSMSNENDQRIAYKLLSNVEKYSIWFEKYQSLINDQKFHNSFSMELNDEQKALIEELKNKVTPNVFDSKINDEKEYFQNIFVPNFIKKAQKVFSYNQIGLLFYKLSKPESDVSLKRLAISTQSNSESCDCNIGAFFTCAWGQDKCKESDCKETFNGCGFNWAYPCDGICDVL